MQHKLGNSNDPLKELIPNDNKNIRSSLGNEQVS